MHLQAGIGAITEIVRTQAPITGIVLAQVIGVSGDDHAVQVMFTTMASIFNSADGSPLKVKVLQRRAGLYGAILELPQVGEWGLVCFPNGSDQMAVWLGSINRDLSNLAWDGIEKYTRLDQHESGVYTLLDDEGNLDMVFRDGSYLRVGTGIELAARFKHERQGQAQRTVPFTNPTGDPATLHLRHSSGSELTITPDGQITVHGASSIEVDGGTTILVDGQGAVTVQSAGVTTVQGGGPAQTIIGGPTAAQVVVLLAGLTNLIAWAATHVHDNVQSGIDQSGPPASPPNTPVPGVDISLNTVAS